MTYTASSYIDPATEGVLCFPSGRSGSVGALVAVNASTMLLSVPPGTTVDGHPLLLSGMTFVAYVVADNADGTVFALIEHVGCVGVAAGGAFSASIQGESTIPAGKTNVTCATEHAVMCQQAPDVAAFCVTWAA